MRIRIRKGIIAIALCTSMILSNINYTGATISDNNSDIHTDENNSGEDKGTVSGNPADESGQPTDDNSTSDGNLDDAPAEEPKDESPVEAPVDISDNEIPLISDIPSDDEEAEDENQNTYSYDDEKIHVEVTVYDNAFDEGIVPELKVDEITEEEQPDKYEEVKNDLQEQFPDEDIKEQKETFKSYDIHFEVDGQEVEPMGGASVSMTFHEALKPDGITEDTQISLIHHVEEKQEENIESKVEVVEDVTIQQNNAEVKAVEFTTETFSTFTIKWGNSVSLSVVCVDSKGFELHESKKPNAINLNQNHKLDINNSNIQINGYTFVVAKVFDDDISSNEEHRTLAATNGYGTEIKRLRRQDNKIKYSTSLNGDWNWTDLPSDKKVYFIYNMTEECIDTVNSKDKGVTINMFDYDAGTYADLTFSNSSNTNGYTGQGGGVTQDLVNKTLENGYPKRGNKSLNILFDPNTSNKFKGESNYLFSQEIYDQTKYFEYDSENNFAHYDEDEDRFYVYDRVGGYTDQNNNGRGEFYPYNTLGNQFVSGKQIYQVNGAPNYYFGMTVMTSFIQPRNGKVDRYVNGIKTDMEDMIFEFSGDDDVWIFIDDVLVLDMGGVHEARWGSINFSTGTVWVDRVYNNGANNNPVTTTIRQRFTQAGKDVSGWKNDNGQSINTFSDYTEHTMKIFYLERGSGASNCKLKFNIPTIPTNRIDVTKEVAGEHNTVETDETFKFQLFTKAIGSNRYVLNKGKEYSVIKKDNSTEEEIGNGTINSEGIFELHQGETARFLDIPAGTKYYVKEVRINDEKYNKVTVISGNTEKVVQISDSIQEVASNENLDPEIIKEVKFINYQKAVTFGRDKIAKLVNWDDRTYNITLTVSANTTNMKGIADKVTVTDILDDRFEFTNDIADGIIDTNNNKKITWTTAESDWAEVDGYSVWTKTFKIKAKDTYAGGNVVPTNHSLSGVVINGWGRNGTDLEMKFPEPMVNVKASVNAEDAKNVFFLGEKIGDVYKDEGAFKKAFGVSENLTGITFTYKENEEVKSKTYTQLNDVTIQTTLADILEAQPNEKMECYDNAFTVMLKPNTCVDSSTITSIADYEKLLTAMECTDSAAKDIFEKDGKRYYAVPNVISESADFTAYVVDGTLSITKNIDAYYEKEAVSNFIKDNQTFIFKIERYNINEDGGVGEPDTDFGTVYETISFSNQDGDDTEKTKSVIGLKKGYYKVTEETNWSWKYKLDKSYINGNEVIGNSEFFLIGEEKTGIDRKTIVENKEQIKFSGLDIISRLFDGVGRYQKLNNSEYEKDINDLLNIMDSGDYQVDFLFDNDKKSINYFGDVSVMTNKFQ